MPFLSPANELDFFYKITHFFPTDLKLNLAPVYSNFEGKHLQKNKELFLVKTFQNVPKTTFLAFQKLSCSIFWSGKLINGMKS